MSLNGRRHSPPEVEREASCLGRIHHDPVIDQGQESAEQIPPPNLDRQSRISQRGPDHGDRASSGFIRIHCSLLFSYFRCFMRFWYLFLHAIRSSLIRLPSHFLSHSKPFFHLWPVDKIPPTTNIILSFIFVL